MQLQRIIGMEKEKILMETGGFAMTAEKSTTNIGMKCGKNTTIWLPEDWQHMGMEKKYDTR